MPAQRVIKSFKDLSMSFKFNPLSGDLITLSNENAIARSVQPSRYTAIGIQRLFKMLLAMTSLVSYDFA